MQSKSDYAETGYNQQVLETESYNITALLNYADHPVNYGVIPENEEGFIDGEKDPEFVQEVVRGLDKARGIVMHDWEVEAEIGEEGLDVTMTSEYPLADPVREAGELPYFADFVDHTDGQALQILLDSNQVYIEAGINLEYSGLESFF